MQLIVLLDGFAFLANDALIDITHAFAFVGFGRIEAANFRGYLSDDLTIRTFYSKFRVFLDGNLDLLRNVINDRVRVTETKIDRFTLDGGFKPDTLNLELLNKAVTYAADHV